MLKPFVLLPFPSDWLNSEQPAGRDKITEPALEMLKVLAAHAKLETGEYHHKHTPFPDSATATRLMQAFGAMPINESPALPTSYKNATLSPYMLIMSAIFENRRHIHAKLLPKGIYASDALLTQLHKDMEYCVGEAFTGKVPFTHLDGTRVYIPVMSAKQVLNILLPRDVVWCAN